MEYKVIYSYDMLNQREESELYNKVLNTGMSHNKFGVGERLYMFGDSISRASATLTSVESLSNPNIKICKTNRSVHIIEILSPIAEDDAVEENSCVNCAYHDYSLSSAPCNECDINYSNFVKEGAEKRCDTCKHFNLPVMQEPCRSCYNSDCYAVIEAE